MYLRYLSKYHMYLIMELVCIFVVAPASQTS